MPDITVIIPTRNRADSLRETLELLADQETGGAFSYEVLVVDNGSTDHTRSAVEALQRSFPRTLRYVYEGRRGRCHALNRGMQQAVGRILAFTDDDVVLSAGWLRTIWGCFEEEQADAVAGRVLPVWIAERPAWLTGKLSGGPIGQLDRGPERLRSTARQFCRWAGASMALRREVVERLGGYDTRLLLVEDTEYYDRCVDAGLKVVYEPGALVYHKIGDGHVTPQTFRRRYYLNGYYVASMEPWRKSHLLTLMPAKTYREAMGFAVGWVKALLARDPWPERFWYELRLRQCFGLWFHRAQLWPRWFLTVMTGRSYLPRSEHAHIRCALPSPPVSAEPDVSVIIATRNRADSLRETLATLATQETGNRFAYEVVVADNGSTDHTRAMVEQLAVAFPVPLRYVYDGRPGKPWALNAGMQAARGSVFACTDDDVIISPTWLPALWSCFSEERADAVAGRVLPLWTGPKPAWLSDQALRKLGSIGWLDHGPSRRRSCEGDEECRWGGANLAIRREAAQRVGAYDVRLRRGEDTDYYRRCIAQGLVVCYEPAAVVQHKVDPSRLTPQHFRRWYHQGGYYRAYRLPWKVHHLLTVTPLWWYRMLLAALRDWVKASLTRRPWWERFHCELVLRELASTWLHRLQLVPRWFLTVLTGRSFMP